MRSYLLICLFTLTLSSKAQINAQIDSIRQDNKNVQNIETDRRFFVQRDFGKYFISDYYAPLTKVHLGYGLKLPEYEVANNRSSVYVLYNETTLGGEVPIYTAKWENKQGKQSKFSVSIPISVSIWFDFLEKETAPILNTDYRFGIGELNYLKETNWGFIKNFAVKFIPLFHESTHIGDELTIARVANNQPITRVNVSYELSELSLTINDANKSMANNHSFKIGARALLNPKKGWYSIRPVEGDAELVKGSKRSVETYFQYQSQFTSGWLAGKKKHFILSAEIRDRIRFGYPLFFTPGGGGTEGAAFAEDRWLSFNGYLGWKFKSYPDKQPNFGAYLRAYTGINPHGQFRNIPFYDFVGIAFIYEP